MKRRFWTDHEIELVRKHLAMKGADKTVEILAKHGYVRTKFAVRQMARRQMIDPWIPDGWMPLHMLTGIHHANATMAIHQRAKRERVLRKGARLNLVPQKWADQVADEIAEHNDLLEYTRGWPTMRDLAEGLGLPIATTHRQFKERRGKPGMAHDYEFYLVRDPYKHYRFHPDYFRALRLPV